MVQQSNDQRSHQLIQWFSNFFMPWTPKSCADVELSIILPGATTNSIVLHDFASRAEIEQLKLAKTICVIL